MTASAVFPAFAVQGDALRIRMQQLAASIGITADDLDPQLPIVYGSTGIWTLLVPVRSLSVCERMKPQNAMFPQILTDMPRASVHPVCMETYHLEAHMHGRHFSSPYAGTVEDPVTGTDSGVMGAYYARYIQPVVEGEKVELIVEQGQEIGKDGRVDVEVELQQGAYETAIYGEAVYVKEFKIEYSARSTAHEGKI